MVKKIFAVIIIGVLVLGMAAGAMAAQANNKAVFVIGAGYYSVNGQTQNMDAAPYNEGGRVMVPIRYLAEACGVQDSNITYNNNAIGLKTDDATISLTVGSGALDVNGSVSYMDVAPVVVNGRSYLPARWVAQALGYTVDFDSADNVVLVYPPGQTPPTVPQKPVVDLSNKETSNPWGLKTIKSITQANISDFDKESFELYGVIITGMNVTDSGITVSQKNDGIVPAAVPIRLLESDNSFNDGTFWGYAPIAPTSTGVRNIQYPLTACVNSVAQPLDDIHKIKYIWIVETDPLTETISVIQFNNPLYGGN